MISDLFCSVLLDIGDIVDIESIVGTQGRTSRVSCLVDYIVPRDRGSKFVDFQFSEQDKR